MKKQELYNKVIAYFQEAMPVAETELHYNNPFELLIAVILSAQCTDKRVNMITPPLYRDFPTPEALAASTPEVIYDFYFSANHKWCACQCFILRPKVSKAVMESS